MIKGFFSFKFLTKYYLYYFNLSGTVDDSELIDGLVLDQKTSGYDGPKKVEKAKIGLIQFCISPPKTDVSRLVWLDSQLLVRNSFILTVFVCRWRTT